MRRVVIESPLAGDFARNKRYALWCAYHCRTLGEAAYASHLLFPQFLDDEVPEDREFGIEAGHAWAQLADVFAFYVDLGASEGMSRAWVRCGRLKGGAPETRNLPPEMFARFEAGELPPHTKAFGL